MISKNYKIIKTKKDLDEALEYINNHEYLAFDTETTGLCTIKDKVIGFSFSGNIGDGFYFPYLSWDTSKKSLVEIWDKDTFTKTLKLFKNKKLLTWNGSYDIRIVKNNLGINLLDALDSEVMLMKHTIDEEGFFGLKTVAIQYQKELGINMEEEANKEQIELKKNVKKNGGSTTKNNYEMYKADLNLMGRYACADADYTFRLADMFLKKLEEQNLLDFFYNKEVMPLYKLVTIPMEAKGVKLDLELIKKYKDLITKDINKLHSLILEELLNNDDVYSWLCFASDIKFPAKKSGNFAQKVVEKFNLNLPKSPSGKYNLTKKNVEKLPDSIYKSFLLGECQLDYEDSRDISIELWEQFNKSKINISSKKQMGEIVFDYMNIKPLSKTDKGSPQFNDTMIQWLSEKGHKWAILLGDYNKLIKIRSAYMDRFLENHIDGRYYFYYKQHGTLSGRFSSDAQQLPRPKEDGELSPLVLKYNNIIRAFFITEENRSFIDSDYESLEPHVFSHVSNDDGLRDIFRKGHDFYSTIAIKTEKLEGVSADKKAENYLKKVDAPRRQKAKAYSLGVPYGMTPYALALSLGIEQKEAEKLYEDYLGGFPELRNWMEESKKKAQYDGFVSTETGRVRHLDKVKKLHAKHGEKLLDFKYRKSLEYKLSKKYGREEAVKKVLNAYRDYKNGINNSRNFQIQGLSASIVNLSMIEITKLFRKNDIDGYVCCTIHDQIIVNVNNNHLQEAKEIVNKVMVSVVDLSIDLKAPPEVSTNWRDGH